MIDAGKPLQIAPLKNDFSGLTASHELKGFFEFQMWKAVGDHRRDVETGLNHRRHLVPSLIHFSPIDSFNRETIEDDEIPIDRRAFRLNTE